MCQNPHERLEPFWQPWPGVSPICHFEQGEGPGDKVDH